MGEQQDWDPDSTLLVVSGVGFRRADDRLQPGPTPWDLATLPVNLGPERIVLSALTLRTPYRSGHAVGRLCAPFVGFTVGTTSVKLFLNVPSLLPKAVEITRARPDEVYWAGGDVTQRVTFGIWTLEPGGLRYPRLWDFATEGQTDGTIEITRVTVNPSLSAGRFRDTGHFRQSAIANRRRLTDAPLGSPQRPARELAPGVVQVPGSWDIVEVRQPDGVVIVEGPMTSSYSAKVVDDARARFASAPIAAVVTTSDAWPHIGGMREYVARGIPIYALDLNVPILSRLFAAKYTTFPMRSRKRRRCPCSRSSSTGRLWAPDPIAWS